MLIDLTDTEASTILACLGDRKSNTDFTEDQRQRAHDTWLRIQEVIRAIDIEAELDVMRNRLCRIDPCPEAL